MPDVLGSSRAPNLHSSFESLESRTLLSAASIRAALRAEAAEAVVSPRSVTSIRRARTPAAPTNLVATAQTSVRATLAWTDNATNEVDYVVQRSLGGSGVWIPVAYLPANSTSYLDRRSNAAYSYRVQALNGAYGSAFSNVATPTASTGSTLDAGFSGPITITQGGTYSGKWESLDPNTPAVAISTDEPVTIINSVVRSRGVGIGAYGNAETITIKNTTGYGLNPNVAGDYVGRFLDVDGFASVTVQNCSLISTAGIYLYNYQGNHTTANTVKILDNSATNIDGRVSNGAGGWLDQAPDSDNYKQFFQINGVQSLVGGEVAYNQVINQQGQSRVEESINISTSTGTRRSPFLIHDNYIQGAFPANDADAEDYTGGGIMVSDNGSAYISAFNNEVVATGGIGIEISSGHDNSIYNNRIIASGEATDGTPLAFSNVGAVIWNFNNETTYTNNIGYGNVIGWVDGDGDRNDSWTPDASSWTGNSSLPGNITPATEAAEFVVWQAKLAKAKLTVGSTVS